MNDTPKKNEERRALKHKLTALIEDYQKAEAPMLAEADKMVLAAIREKFALIQLDSLQSGRPTGKMTLEIVFDFTTGNKGVEVRSLVLPLPATTIERKRIEY